MSILEEEVARRSGPNIPGDNPPPNSAEQQRQGSPPPPPPTPAPPQSPIPDSGSVPPVAPTPPPPPQPGITPVGGVPGLFAPDIVQQLRGGTFDFGGLPQREFTPAPGQFRTRVDGGGFNPADLEQFIGQLDQMPGLQNLLRFFSTFLQQASDPATQFPMLQARQQAQQQLREGLGQFAPRGPRSRADRRRANRLQRRRQRGFGGGGTLSPTGQVVTGSLGSTGSATGGTTTTSSGSFDLGSLLSRFFGF